MNSLYPNVEFEKMELWQNHYEDRNGKRWNATTLIAASKDLPEFDLPLAGIDISRKSWPLETTEEFVYHMKRCHAADLKHPILLDDEGCICDGWHRISKALFLGKKTIKAKRFQLMPEPDAIREDE